MKSDLELEKATGAHHQVSKILGAMCDAVIRLDDKLRISDGASKLKALLAMPSSSDVLCQPFGNFIAVRRFVLISRFV